jgi:hypothetical protein
MDGCRIGMESNRTEENQLTVAQAVVQSDLLYF